MKRILLIAFSAFACMNINAQGNVLQETGNVGIGTTSPNYKLDVKGKVHIDSALVVNDSLVIEKNAHIKKRLTADEIVKFTGVQQNNTITDQEFIMIKPGGILEKIEKGIVGTELARIIYEEKQCSEAYLNAPRWQNGLQKIFVPCPEVSVGIGTNTPMFNLDVRGTSYTTKIALGELPGGATSPLFYMKNPQAQTTSNEIFVIENSSRKVFQINNNGTVRARQILLDQLLWADYVFQPGYKMLTLPELEKYIETYKHLPNIPDAKTIENTGIDLSEMSRRQMEKIEEITLYMIEQDKINKEQSVLIQQQAELLQKQAAQIESLMQQLQK